MDILNYFKSNNLSVPDIENLLIILKNTNHSTYLSFVKEFNNPKSKIKLSETKTDFISKTIDKIKFNCSIVNNIIYNRISSSKQKDNYSFDIQNVSSANLVNNNFHTINEVYSVYKKIPPKLDFILRYCKNYRLIIYTLCRLCRNIGNFENIILPLLIKNNISIITSYDKQEYINYNSNTLYLIRNYIMKAQNESDIKKERSNAFQIYKKNFVKKKYGYTRNNIIKKKIKLNSKEKKIIDLIVSLKKGNIPLKIINLKLKKVLDMCKIEFEPIVINDKSTLLNSGLTYSNIALLLNDYNIFYKNNRLWSSSILRNIVKNNSNIDIIMKQLQEIAL